MLGAIAIEEGLTFEVNEFLGGSGRMICSQYCLSQQTLTGFKWMANRAYDLEEQDSKNKVLLAYEEAIGFMCGSQVLDKDGISAAIRIAELMAYLDAKEGITLSEKLVELYQKYFEKLNDYQIIKFPLLF